jgi:hypothetical protein
MQVNNRNAGLKFLLNESSSPVRAGDMGQIFGKKNTDNSVATMMLKAGIDPIANPELKEALTLLADKGYSISKDVVSNLQQFLKMGPGSMEEKLASIQALVPKGLEMTSTHLSSVHNSLHGTPAIDVLQEFLTGSGIPLKSDVDNRQAPSNDDIIENLQKLIKENPTKIAEMKDLISKLNLPDEVKAEIQKVIQIIEAGNARPQDAAKLQQIGLTKLADILQGLKAGSPLADASDPLQKLLQSAMKDVQQEVSLSKVLDSLKQLLTNFSNEDELTSSFEKATQLAGKGQEQEARNELTNALTKFEQLQMSTNANTLTQAEQYLINEAVQSLPIDSKNIIVTEITKKLSQMAIDFKNVKQDITKNLDQFNRAIEDKNQTSPTQMKQLLESSIKKLDNAILKGNYLLYTDMATEKKLLTASTQLAEAKNLLMKGQHFEANQIVKEVKTLVDQLVYKPSDVRVKHYVAEQSQLLREMHPAKQLALGLQQAIKPFPEQDPSARQIFETVKRLGLTNENDLAHHLLGPSKGEPELAPNLKSTIMKMMQLEDGQMPKQALEQALSNITGQQLLNKQDSNGLHNLFMQLPILLNKQVENVKVYLNSQKKGEKIDWENCSLYFVLETKKIGDVGILVTATNRNLAITLKNNREGFKEKMELLTETSVQRLKEIGYNVGTVQYKPFSQAVQEIVDPSPSEKETPQHSTDKKKGYDVSI